MSTLGAAEATLAIGEMVRLLEERKKTASPRQSDLSAWRQELIYTFEEEEVLAAAEDELVPLEPHHVTQVLSELITGEAVISTGGIDHSETGATEFFRHIKPTEHTELSLAEVIGVAAARPDAVVVHIDGGGWYSPRIINLSFAAINFTSLNVKLILLNYEDCDRAGTKTEYCDKAKYFSFHRVTKKSELRAAIKAMYSESWCLLEVVLPKHASFCGGGGRPAAVNKISE